MKKLFPILSIFVSLALFCSCSRTDVQQKNTPMDIQGTVGVIDNAKFKLYKTQNMWTFLKLNTATGQIWQVQYSTKGEEYRFETPLSLKILNTSGLNGRYVLFTTDNIYNFVMLDQFDGISYQVQWSGDAENRFVIPIQ